MDENLPLDNVGQARNPAIVNIWFEVTGVHKTEVVGGPHMFTTGSWLSVGDEIVYSMMVIVQGLQ